MKLGENSSNFCFMCVVLHGLVNHPSSGKTTLLLALAGKFRKEPRKCCMSYQEERDANIILIPRSTFMKVRIKLTAAQALSHPWARENGNASMIPLEISVLSNMRQFVIYNRLKQLALRALTSTLDEEEISNLKDQFHAIDVDKTGAINLEKMRQALAKDIPWKVKGSHVLEILQAEKKVLLVSGFQVLMDQRGRTKKSSRDVVLDTFQHCPRIRKDGLI